MNTYNFSTLEIELQVKLQPIQLSNLTKSFLEVKKQEKTQRSIPSTAKSTSQPTNKSTPLKTQHKTKITIKDWNKKHCAILDQ